MNGEPVFQPFGTAHLVVIALIGLPVFFWATARGPGREGYRVWLRVGLAALLTAHWVEFYVLRVAQGQFVLVKDLPMQLCDWATAAAIVALMTRRQWWYEAAYFWGLSGTLQAVLTPDLREGFPSVHFFNFFVGHSGLVVAVLVLTAVEGLRPHGWSIVRVILWTEVYCAAALVVNHFSGEDYGFLSERPPTKSLLDYLSNNHGMYLLEMHLLEVAFYLVLYAPFWVRDAIEENKFF